MYQLNNTTQSAIPYGRTDTKIKTAIITDNSKLVSLDQLKQFPEMLRIQATNNAVISIRFGYFLQKLRELDLSHNKIPGVEPLSGAVSLVQLDLSYNQIQDIDALRCLKNLEYLNVSNNRLVSLNLRGMTSLTELVADNNQIAECRDIEGNKQMQALSLRNNQIRHFSSICCIGGFQQLKQLHIEGNPICGSQRFSQNYSKLISRCNLLAQADPSNQESVAPEQTRADTSAPTTESIIKSAAQSRESKHLYSQLRLDQKQKEDQLLKQQQFIDRLTQEVRELNEKTKQLQAEIDSQCLQNQQKARQVNQTRGLQKRVIAKTRRQLWAERTIDRATDAQRNILLSESTQKQSNLPTENLVRKQGDGEGQKASRITVQDLQINIDEKNNEQERQLAQKMDHVQQDQPDQTINGCEQAHQIPQNMTTQKIASLVQDNQDNMQCQQQVVTAHDHGSQQLPQSQEVAQERQRDDQEPIITDNYNGDLSKFDCQQHQEKNVLLDINSEAINKDFEKESTQKDIVMEQVAQSLQNKQVLTNSMSTNTDHRATQPSKIEIAASSSLQESGIGQLDQVQQFSPSRFSQQGQQELRDSICKSNDEQQFLQQTISQDDKSAEQPQSGVPEFLPDEAPSLPPPAASSFDNASSQLPDLPPELPPGPENISQQEENRPAQLSITNKDFDLPNNTSFPSVDIQSLADEQDECIATVQHMEQNNTCAQTGASKNFSTRSSLSPEQFGDFPRSQKLSQVE